MRATAVIVMLGLMGLGAAFILGQGGRSADELTEEAYGELARLGLDGPTSEPSTPAEERAAREARWRSQLGVVDSEDSEVALSAGDGGPAFYKYTDDAGRVHFVKSLADVPPRYQRTVDNVAVSTRIIRREAERAPKRKAFQDFAPAASRADVVVYTAPWCGWCTKTLKWLDRNGVSYTNKDIDSNPQYKAELRAKLGATSIPVVEIGDQTVRGYSPQRMKKLLAL